MPTNDNKFLQIILAESKKAQISSDLVRAIIKVESNFNPKAIRYEDHFRYLHMPERYAQMQDISLETEKQLQKFSYGLSQLMGGTARWLGFNGFLPELCDPLTNVQWMMVYLNKCCNKLVYTNDKIAAYNAGSVMKDPVSGKYLPKKTQDYVDKVVVELDKIQNAGNNYKN